MHRARTLLIKIVMQAVHFIILLVGVSFLTFSLLHLSPPNPAELWPGGADRSAGLGIRGGGASTGTRQGLDPPVSGS